jgi:DNA-binding MurR/RpiR family transcriptional regulator
MLGGLIFLREVLNDLPGGERCIAEYILANPQQLARMNILQLAQKSGASAAGVVRLCKRLNIDGFAELKLRVTLDASQEPENPRAFHLAAGLSIEEIARSVVSNGQKTLGDMLKMLNITALEEAVEKILAAKRIDIYGIGASGIVALDFFQKLQRIGMACTYTPDSHLQITSACGLTEKDVGFAVSYSGATRVIVQVVMEAKKSGAFIITLTRFGRNPLTDLADVALYVPSAEPLVREAAMASRLAQLSVVDILFSTIASRNCEGVLKQLARTSAAVKKDAI